MERVISEHRDSRMCELVAALHFPCHYPPKNFWKKFFIGIRWFGPDLTFFKAIEDLQAARNENCWNLWGNGLRLEVAKTVADIIWKSQGWRSNVFIPDDKLNVVWNGPKFRSIDDLEFESALRHIEKKYEVKIPKAFWTGMEESTFGEFVDKFVALTEATN